MRWRAARMRYLAQMSQPVWFAAIVVGGLAHWPALIVVGGVLAAVAGIALVLMSVYRHKMYVLASQHLGRKLNWRNGWRKTPVREDPAESPQTHPMPDGRFRKKSRS